MLEFLAVGLGGFLGSCLRYAVTKLTEGFSPFPFGTLISNVVAGLFVGFVLGLDKQSPGFPKHSKLFLTTGLMGGLSTFSAFSFETVELFGSGRHASCIGNVLLNLCLSLSGVALGLAVAKKFV